MGRRSGNYPPELRERTARMVAHVRPEYPSDRGGAVEVKAYRGSPGRAQHRDPANGT
jgi:hypothetical protein